MTKTNKQNNSNIACKKTTTPPPPKKLISPQPFFFQPPWHSYQFLQSRIIYLSTFSRHPSYLSTFSRHPNSLSTFFRHPSSLPLKYLFLAIFLSFGRILVSICIALVFIFASISNCQGNCLLSLQIVPTFLPNFTSKLSELTHLYRVLLGNSTNLWSTSA